MSHRVPGLSVSHSNLKLRPLGPCTDPGSTVFSASLHLPRAEQERKLRELTEDYFTGPLKRGFKAGVGEAGSSGAGETGAYLSYLLRTVKLACLSLQFYIHNERLIVPSDLAAFWCICFNTPTKINPSLETRFLTFKYFW